MTSKTEGGTGRARRKAARPISVESSDEVFDYSKPEAIEALARIEGQSNFLSILAGIEAGPDTTMDMAALSFARTRGAMPEILEAYVAQTDRHKIPIMSMIFKAIVSELRPKKKDYPWIRGTVADAFLLLRFSDCKPLNERAKHFGVRLETYAALRKVALSTMWRLVDEAEGMWKYARHATPRERPGERLTTNKHVSSGGSK